MHVEEQTYLASRAAETGQGGGGSIAQLLEAARCEEIGSCCRIETTALRARGTEGRERAGTRREELSTGELEGMLEAELE